MAEDRLCTSSDVLERRNVARVAMTVATLMAFHRGRPAAVQHYTGV
uniref:Uncharacterized protein n=1 Tax=Daphnia galeata TaxID=27404 RepID=A0A8J2S361_9CRUS|nr:unnamed protein product [Daphnia galeata]